ncbi:protein argonaute-3 [Physcia stellaris]|nr:protein argonaute-3 [Physcia stellaris]
MEDKFVQCGSVPEQLNLRMCLRPGYGTRGSAVTLWTNYFEVKSQASHVAMYLYTMTVDPSDKYSIPKGKKRKQLINLMLRDPMFWALKPVVIATDFNENLLTKTPLAFSGETARISVNFRGEGALHAPEKPITYTVSIKKKHTLNLSDFQDYLDPTKMTSEYNKSPVLEALNIIHGYHSKQSQTLTTVGAKRVFPLDQQGGQPIPPGLVALRGFYSSVIGATSRILVNVNITHCAFHKQRPLGELIWELCPEHNQDDIDYPRLQQFLKRLRVTTNHLTEKDKAFGKVRTIFGLAMSDDGTGRERPPKISGRKLGAGPAAVSFFENVCAPSSSTSESSRLQISTNSMKENVPPSSATNEGKYINVQNFFRKSYPYSVKACNLDRTMPVVNVGTKEIPIYLPAEVCDVQPGQLAKLKDDQTKSMIEYAKVEPAFCARKIVQDGLTKLGFSPPSEALAELGLTVGDDLITVPGRLLKAPEIQYKENFVQYPITKLGGWNFAGNRLYDSKKLPIWYCLRIAERREDNNMPPATMNIGGVLKNFRQILSASGVKCERGPVMEDLVLRNVHDTTTQLILDVEPSLRKILEQHAKTEYSENGTPQNNKADPPLVLVILPNKVTKLYHAIKILGDTKLGIHTVCVIGSAVKPNPKSSSQNKLKETKFYAESADQYFANVALKINLKLKGINHLLKDNQGLDIINKGSTMVIGLDVTHPSPGSHEDAPSIFALVASINRQLAQWPVELGVQRKSREEVISNKSRLIEMFQSLLQRWRSENGELPENVIIYRDGVSEGQYQQVLDAELSTFKEACHEMYRSGPSFTFIIVAKRHHTRFYPTEARHADSTHNAKCGTVVDRGITQARDWDFFLQSHSVIGKGVARPAHYIILHDEVFEDRQDRADLLQNLTFNMCYLFGRATKAISVCPPAYLADLACTRARSYLHDQFVAPPAPPKKKDEKAQSKPETEAERKYRLAEKAKVLRSQQKRIEIHSRLKDSMFYI